VTVKGDTLEFGQARVLFGGRSFNDANGGSFSSDWKRTLVSLSAGGDTSSSLVMVSNWTAELKK
jgi:hypothetical protein